MTLNNESIKTAPNRHGTLMKYCGFALAVAAAFTAVYLFSGNRGAWQGVPIILFAPVISDILFKNSKAVCAVYALIAFIMSRFDGESIEYSVKYTAVVLGIAVVSIFVKRLVVTALVYKENRKLFAALFVFAAVICAAALFVYPMYNGTFFGNLRAAEVNRTAFLEKYSGTGIESTGGKTYYSRKAGGYLTEMRVSAYNNVIIADYCADGTHGEVDGYKNYCARLMMDEKADEIKHALSFSYTSGIDFAVRPGDYSGDDVLLPDSRTEEYADKMSFEIAFYDRTDTAEEFAALCRSYNGIIEESGLVYESITYYGVNGYTFQMTLPHGYTGEITANEAEKFDRSTFKKYSSDSDVKENWK